MGRLLVLKSYIGVASAMFMLLSIEANANCGSAPASVSGSSYSQVSSVKAFYSAKKTWLECKKEAGYAAKVSNINTRLSNIGQADSFINSIRTYNSRATDYCGYAHTMLYKIVNLAGGSSVAEPLGGLGKAFIEHGLNIVDNARRASNLQACGFSIDFRSAVNESRSDD